MKRKLLLDGNRGIYLPVGFIEYVWDNDRDSWHGIDEDTAEIVRDGPEHPDYWECWEEILNNATWCGHWRLEHDDDLFLILEDTR